MSVVSCPRFEPAPVAYSSFGPASGGLDGQAPVLSFIAHGTPSTHHQKTVDMIEARRVPWPPPRIMAKTSLLAGTLVSKWYTGAPSDARPRVTGA